MKIYRLFTRHLIVFFPERLANEKMEATKEPE